MNKIEKIDKILIYTTTFFTALLVLCLITTISYNNIFLNITIIICSEILLMLSFLTNKPLTTPNDYMNTYHKIVYSMPDYKVYINIVYSSVGVIMNMFIYIILQIYENINVCVLNLCTIIVFLSFSISFIVFVINSIKRENNTLRLGEMFEIFDKYFPFDNLDNKEKLTVINSFKYEILFNKPDIIDFFIFLSKSLPTIIGILGLTALIKDKFNISLEIMLIASISLLSSAFKLSILQKTKTQVFYALDMYIKDLENKIEKEEKQQ